MPNGLVRVRRCRSLKPNGVSVQLCRTRPREVPDWPARHMGVDRAKKHVTTFTRSRTTHKLALRQKCCRQHGSKASWALAGERMPARSSKAVVGGALQLPTLGLTPPDTCFTVSIDSSLCCLDVQAYAPAGFPRWSTLLSPLRAGLMRASLPARRCLPLQGYAAVV